MYRSPLKVYGEYLIPKSACAAGMTGTSVVRAGKSGLEVVVCAEAGDDPDAGFGMDAGDSVTITLLHSQDGETFITMPAFSQTLEAQATFLPGDIIARMTLPHDCLPHIKGNLAFSTPPAGNVSMFPAYWPR